MYTKQIGRFTIVADNKPDLKGYFTPGGTALRQEDIWKGNVFYEQDYFPFTHYKIYVYSMIIKKSAHQLLTK